MQKMKTAYVFAHGKRITALLMILCLLTLAVSTQGAALIDEDEASISYFRYYAVGNDDDLESVAIIVNIPGKGVYAYTQGSDGFGDEPEGYLIDLGGDAIYDMEFSESLGSSDENWFVWKVNGLAEDSPGVLYAAAPHMDGPYVTCYMIYSEEKSAEFAYDKMNGMKMGKDFQDGSAMLQLSDSVTEVTEQKSLLAGFVINSDGGCVGVLLKDDIVYCDWYDEAVFDPDERGDSGASTGNEEGEDSVPYEIELRFGVYDTQNDEYLRWADKSALTTDSLEEGQIFSPVFRITNKTDKDISLELKADINGESFYWTADVPAKESANHWCTDPSVAALGRHTCVYYIDDEEVLSDSYTIKTSSQSWPVVKFGHFEQDNDISNGQEPIEWLVLDEKDGYSLLLSKKILDVSTFDFSGTFVTWDASSLRRYLNKVFIDQAFTDSEKRAIDETVVDNSAEQQPSKAVKTPVKDTLDQVFLLSDAEVRYYFESDSDRSCEVSKYARALGKKNLANIDGWWLRTVYDSQNASLGWVNTDGKISGARSGIQTGIRPAIWVETAMLDN